MTKVVPLQIQSPSISLETHISNSSAVPSNSQLKSINQKDFDDLVSGNKHPLVYFHIHLTYAGEVSWRGPRRGGDQISMFDQGDYRYWVAKDGERGYVTQSNKIR